MATPHATEIAPPHHFDLEARMSPERILLVSNNKKLLAAANITNGFKLLIGTGASLYIADGSAALDHANPYGILRGRYGLVVIDLYAFRIGSEELKTLNRNIVTEVGDAEKIIGMNGRYVGCEKGHPYPETVDLHHLSIILKKAHDSGISQRSLEGELLPVDYKPY